MVEDDGHITVYPPADKKLVRNTVDEGSRDWWGKVEQAVESSFRPMRKVTTSHNGRIDITVREHERLKRIEDAAINLRKFSTEPNENVSSPRLAAIVRLWQALDS